MNQSLLRTSLYNHATFSFARSGGPGGQNVNKVNTKVLLSIRLDLLDGLTENETMLIKERLIKRISPEGTLLITCEEERSQYRNKEIALKKAEFLLIKAGTTEIKRIPTRPSKASKLRRLSQKKHRSTNKVFRKKPTPDD